MAANEISERVAAACWVQCGSAGGEVVNVLDPAQIRFRSLHGFQQRIITTTNALTLPVLILPLDRTFSRRECAVIATRLATGGPNAASLLTYPNLIAPSEGVPQVFVQPIMLEWLGPDLSAPTFFPFGLVNGAIPLAPPAGSNLELFDAIAVLLPVPEASDPSSGDFCVLVLEHPPLEGVTVLEPDVPAPVVPPVPDPFALLTAWFRADTFQSLELGYILEGRVGTEGDLTVGEGTDDPAPDPLVNNQDSVPAGNSEFVSSAPAAFWDFLGEGPWTFYGVAYPTVDNLPENLFTCGPYALRMLPSSTDGELQALGNELIELEYPETALSVGQWTKFILDAPLQLVNTAVGTATPILPSIPSGPPGVPLTVRGTGGGGEIAIQELMWWNFPLSVPQQAIVEAYLTARYGTPFPPPPDPISALNPTAWFRGDTFTEAGGFTVALTGRMGTEGNLVAQIASYVPPAVQAAANNQLGLQYGDQANNNLVSSMPAAFWDFLQSENTFIGAIFLVPGAGIQRVFTTAADDVRLEVDSTGVESAQVTWGAAGANAQFAQAFPAANIGVKQYSAQRLQAGEPSPILWDLVPAAGQNGGSFAIAPPGSVGAPLQLGNTTGGAQLGPVVLLDLVFFDRALSSGEIAVWDAYTVERYGAF